MASPTRDTTAITPARDDTAASEITYAPKRARRPGVLGCFRNMKPPLRYEWPLADGRVGGYIFDKEEERSVKLYTLDTPGTCFTDDMQHISYNTEEWMMSKTRFWNNLGVSRQDSDHVVRKIEILFKMGLLEDRCNAIKVRLFLTNRSGQCRHGNNDTPPFFLFSFSNLEKG